MQWYIKIISQQQINDLPAAITETLSLHADVFILVFLVINLVLLTLHELSLL